jgi:sulfite reductase (NADPH) flavoprotein alpha-component
MNEKAKYCLKNPFVGTIKKVLPLNKEGSTKSNFHVEISIEGSNIEYEVGCSFGLYPFNPSHEVDTLLNLLKVDKECIIKKDKIDHPLSIHSFFLEHVNLLRVTKKIATAFLPYQKDQKLQTLLEGDWKQYSDTHDLVEFLTDFYLPTMPLQELIDLMSPLLPRFYSIASCQKIVGNTIILLVANFSYMKGKKWHKSLTATHVQTQKTISLFHQPNPSFSPPKEDIPIIMIGPGTGIAAFLGFLQERIDLYHCKNNLLFTGDRNEKYDFYYEKELKDYQNQGFLHLFTAFSRDHSKKVYVQDRILEQKELIKDLILNKKGEIFISGDAERMAKDVLASFEKIFSTHSIEEGHTFIRELKKQKRIHLDVY